MMPPSLRLTVTSCKIALVICVGFIPYEACSRVASTSAARDLHFGAGVRSSEVIFAGELVRAYPSDCAESGMALSRQGFQFRVDDVLWGAAPKSEMRVDAVILRTGWLQVERNGCRQLDPDALLIGRHYIVGSNRVTELGESEGWVIAGGPWADDQGTRARIKEIITQGPYSKSDLIWKMNEDTLSNWIEGATIEKQEIEGAIRFFEETTRIDVAVDAKGASLDRAKLARYLEELKRWYERNRARLRYDPALYKVVLVDRSDSMER